MTTTELRDARPVELFDEPDCVLAGLADGSIEATWMTRALAIRELEQRAAALERRSDGD